MIFDKTFKAHRAWILSCFGPRAGAWFTVWPIFLAFWLSSLVFYITLCTQLGLPNPSIANILWCVCTHFIDPMGIHFLCCVHGNKHTRTHDAICDTFAAIAWDVGFPRETRTITCACFNHIQFLSLANRHCAYQRWHLHLNRHCHYRPNTNKFTSPILCNSRICYIRYNSSQGKELSQSTPHWSSLPLSNWGIWLLT